MGLPCAAVRGPGQGDDAQQDAAKKEAEEQQKKAKDSKGTSSKTKEVKFRPGTDEGDYQVKLRNLVKFLTTGDKAKITKLCRVAYDEGAIVFYCGHGPYRRKVSNCGSSRCNQ